MINIVYDVITNYNMLKKSEIEHSSESYETYEKTKHFNKYSNVILGIIITILLFITVFAFISVSSSTYNSNIYRCSRCNKTFTDSANTKSIAYSNFCEKCHDDVEFLKEVQDAME